MANDTTTAPNPFATTSEALAAGLSPADIAASTASGVEAQVGQAQRSQTVNNQTGQNASSQDWRLRISLAEQSEYLYNQQNPGILAPLKKNGGTNGVIFPYTPSISTAYKANYNPYDLVHSNYRGYFYQNSSVDSISVKGMFTAQNYQEAQYLLAVIHFFKAASKMFYGSKDPNAGSPPPILYMTGLGAYQFNKHSVLLSTFDYTLPADVDYIRTTIPLYNEVRQNQRARSTPAYSAQFAGITRLATALNIFGQPIQKGGVFTSPAGSFQPPEEATYVPTKIDINLTLLPIQTRQQVTNGFNMQDFANGKLIKQGYW